MTSGLPIETARHALTRCQITIFFQGAPIAMPAPVYSAGIPGNLINGVSVNKGATVAAFLDLSTAVEGQVNCELVTGGTAPTAGTIFSAYRAYAAGAAAPITLFANASAGATSLAVSSATGLHVGQNVALQQVSGSRLGEVVTITAISGTTLTVSATINSYSSGDGLYYIGQTAAFAVAPQAATGGWAANKDYSAPLYLPTGQYIFAATNSDASQTVTVNATVDKITGYQ